MKNLLLVLFVFVLLILGCQREQNQVLSDSQIPPEEQLIKISARNWQRIMLMERPAAPTTGQMKSIWVNG